MKVKISDIFDFEKGTLQSSKNIVGEYNFITASSEWKKHNAYTHECEALVIAVAASGSLGRTHYVKDKFIASDLCFVLQPKPDFIEKINLKFYYEYFNFIKDDLVYKTATGSAKKAINKFNFAKYQVILPSREYQDKIVQKLYELKEDFNTINEKFEYNAELVKKLRQSILQDAIKGKLVAQDPNDEPASEFLKHIKAEKEQLIKEGKIKKDNINFNFDKEDFLIPITWKWVLLKDICSVITDGTHKTPTYLTKGIPFLSVKNVRPYNINDNDKKFISLEEHNLICKRCKPEKGDILYTKVGATYGYAAINKLDYEFSIFVSLALIKPMHKYFTSEYAELVLNSPYVYKQASERISGIAVPDLHLVEIRSFKIPLPPLEEQKRIVARVKELMQLCDKLENENNNAQKYSSELLQSIMQKYFTPEV